MRGGLELREKGLRKEVHTHTHAHTYTNMAGSPASVGNVVGAQAMQAHAVSASTLPGLPRTGGERSETVSVSVEHARTSSVHAGKQALMASQKRHACEAGCAACCVFVVACTHIASLQAVRRSVRSALASAVIGSALALSLALGGGTAAHALQRGAVELLRAAHEEGLTQGLRTNLGCG